MSNFPFISIGHDELKAKPDLEENETVCPRCKKLHKIEYGKDKDGYTTQLSFIICPKTLFRTKKIYLVGINGKKL